MPQLMKSRTLSFSIDCNSKKAYEFISDPVNFPKWAKTFCRAVRKSNGKWLIETPQGAMSVRFSPANEFGVVDHYVAPSPGVEVYVPLRVVPNGSGSEIIFTLFQQPGMSDENFAADEELVRKDLNALKEVLED